MPNIDCLNNEIADLKKGQNLQANQIMKLSHDVSENTKVTIDTKSDTAEIIELMKWMNTTKKIVLWLGGFVAGVWGLYEGVKHFKL